MIGSNFGLDLTDAVMICKSEIATLSRIECSFISALVEVVSIPGTVSSDSNKLHLHCTVQKAADLAYVRHLILTAKFKLCSVCHGN